MDVFISPFSPYTNTNYVPDERERLQILQLLERPVTESKRLEEEISNMEAQLEAFILHRQSLQGTIDQHGRLASASRRLSDDILREIFIQCLPSDHNAVMSINEPPFVLALVCRRWKVVVYETPRLWASLHIPLPTYPTRDTADPNQQDFERTVSNFHERIAAHCTAIHTWLSRSGVCPLSISFHPSLTYPINSNNHLALYLETLLSFSSRWHTIDLTILTGAFSSFFAAVPATSVPVLHTLNITFAQHWQDWNQPHSSLWNKSGLINPPSLRRLGLYHCPALPSSLEVDWSRLTRLDIPNPRVPWQDKGLSLKETHALLSHCQNLVHVSIDVEDLEPSADPFPPISLAHLESIEILDAAMRLETLLKSVHLPRLRTIRFHSLFVPSSRRASTLTTILSRTEPSNIESLSTNLQLLTFEELTGIIRQTPNLTLFSNEASRRGPSDEQSLLLRNLLDFPIDFVAAALAMLTPETGIEPLWPCLTHLYLGRVRRLTDDAILKFIVKRMEAEGAEDLKSVKITFYRDVMDDILPALRGYVECGLSVNLVYPSTRVAIPGSIRPRKAIFKRNSIFRP